MNGHDPDPYALLGVHRGASASDVRRAYRRAARATHPDSQPWDPTASQRFNVVNDAYDTLRDPARRAAYDRAHPVVRVVARRAAPAPPPVRLGSRPTAPVADPFGIGPRPTPLGRRHRAWGAPVDVPIGPRPLGPLRPSADAELADLAALLARLLRTAGR